MKPAGHAVRRAMTIVAAIVVAITSLTAILLACGPFLTVLVPVTALFPAHDDQYRRGELGVVRPRFARAYLVQAYRVLNGKPPLPAERAVDAPANRPRPLADEWPAERDAVLGGTAPRAGTTWRSLGNYQQIENCNDDAFANAVRTLRARAARFGRSSRELVEWTRAQVVVFRNCGDGPLSLPDAVPAGADPLVRADRDYQTAASYFYAMKYDDAAQRFRAIAGDRSSPWRPQGRYLAARALIRRATVPENEPAAVTRFFTDAESELNAVLADAQSSTVHGQARRLLGFVEGRLHPIERLHAVARNLATMPAPNDQDLIDYRVLMNRLVGDTVNYAYDSVRDREAMIRDDDLTDWILAVQGGGKPGLERAFSQWQHSQSPHWLVAVLWNVEPEHAAVQPALDAAAQLGRSSPAYATVAFLRVRLLARLGRTEEARALLATLPSRPEEGFSDETVNLLRAERLMLAPSFDDVLVNAPRAIVVSWDDQGSGLGGRIGPRLDHTGAVTFDADATLAFNHRLPLDRLVEAATKSILPQRLRRRVAIAAFTRALLLNREDTAVGLAPLLSTLAPALRADLDRYTAAATSADRRRAGLLLLTRTPGMRTMVAGPDDDFSYAVVEPVKKFDHLLRRTWWCGTEIDQSRSQDEVSESVALLYPSGDVPYPAFLTDSERAVVERELEALRAIGPARSYLARETIAWARATPQDANVAEALALVVEGWRWNCGDNDQWTLARQAFRILHGQYPQSEWARKTRYWYR
jgi:hypothetical protein